MATLKKLKGYFSSIGIILYTTPILVIIEVCAELAQPYFIGLIIDKGIKYRDESQVISLATIMILIAILGLLAGLMNTYYISRISQEFGMNLRESTFDKVQGLSFKNIDELNISNLIIVLTNDINQLQHYIRAGYKIIFRSPSLLLGTIIFGLILSPRLIGIFMPITLGIAAILYLILKQSFPIFFKAQSVKDDYNTILSENFSGIETVKGFAREKYEEEKFTEINDNLTTLNIKANKIMSLIFPVILLFTNISIVILLWFGSKEINYNYLSIGSIVSYINYTLIFIEGLILALIFFINISRANVLAKRIDNILTTRAHITYSDSSNTITPIRGDIIFENVSFDYDNSDGYNASPLKNINLHINSGDFVGILGNKDSGKGIIANMISRFYDPSSGKVLLDGVDIRNYTKASLRNNISIFMKSSTLFSNTVHSDMGQDNLDSMEDDVTRAAKLEQVKIFKELLPENYENIEYEENILIDNQKELELLSPALINSPKILILDDSCDYSNEEYAEIFKKAINKELYNTTVIMVANKISSIMNADNIFLIDKGQIIVEGKHTDLLKNSVHYMNIYKNQNGEE
ncbi:ABC transporter ATP-binding protein [Clostridium paraputrificum]|uniref:ABC transporter ATP-binding protein n=1 Tax=Clostridium TaxID=1485 RepID=UPI003D34ED9E